MSRKNHLQKSRPEFETRFSSEGLFLCWFVYFIKKMQYLYGIYFDIF